MSSSPIPMLLCGKFDTHLQATTDIAKPDIEVVKQCTSTESATAFLRAVMNDQPFEGQRYAKPQIITMGGGYTNEDQESLAACVDGLKEMIVWFRPEFRKPGSEGPAPTGPPPADVIAKKFRAGLDENLSVIREGKGRGEVFYY